jgi:hypothetical protein
MPLPTLPQSASPPWWETFAALLIIAALQMATVFNPMVVEVDMEEMFNAGQAWQVMECSKSELFRLQYREFCGGCTLNSLLGTFWFTVWERSWIAWKLVPLSFLLLMAGLASRTLHRLAGRPAAWAFIALLALPPRAWMFLSLIAWGNHYEAGCMALVSLLLLLRTEGPRMATLTGIALGVCVWIGFSGVFAVSGALLWLCWTRRFDLIPHVIGGIALGLIPWGLQWRSTGQHAFVTIYETNESAPALSRIPYKLATLMMPRQLAALFGGQDPAIGWKLGWAWAAVLAGSTAVLFIRVRSAASTPIGRAASAVLLFGGCWLAIYSVVRFQVDMPPAPQIAYPGSARYAAPIYPMAFFTLALVAGLAWRRDPRLGLGILFFPLLSGLQARKQAFSDPYPAASVALLEPVDWDYFKPRFAYLYDDANRLAFLDECSTNDPRTLELHAYTHGRVESSNLLRETNRSFAELEPPQDAQAAHWWEGVGDALGMHLDNPELYGGAEVDSLKLMRRAQARLDEMEGASQSERREAMRAIAFLRMGASDPWIQARNSHDDEAIQKITDGLSGVEEELAEAAWWAHGRQWAHTVVGFHTPDFVHLPPGVEQAPRAFFEGLGRGLGEEWGPAESIPIPTNLPYHGKESLKIGYRDGVARRWLEAEGQELPSLTWP